MSYRSRELQAARQHRHFINVGIDRSVQAVEDAARQALKRKRQKDAAFVESLRVIQGLKLERGDRVTLLDGSMGEVDSVEGAKAYVWLLPARRRRIDCAVDALAPLKK